MVGQSRLQPTGQPKARKKYIRCFKKTIIGSGRVRGGGPPSISRGSPPKGSKKRCRCELVGNPQRPPEKDSRLLAGGAINLGREGTAASRKKKA